jgi:ligand-binding sensor domain-containing protein
MEQPVNYSVPFILFFVFLISTAAAAPANSSPDTLKADPYTITLFLPSPNMIHSDQILDQVNTPEGGVLFGTSFGLSMYNGTWSSRHVNRENISAGLMDEFITAVEYDRDGNLWIGYSGGIQIYNGIYYTSLRDQQLFKDPRIQDIQRWHDDVWVATGNSGIHRYRNGIWTWFQPMSKEGPGFYEVKSMTIDPASDILVIASFDNGIWIVRSANDPVSFEQIAPKKGTYGLLEEVRRDPRGGVYLFNDTMVIHYSPNSGFQKVLTQSDLSFSEMSINDLTAAPDGKLYLATDDGIYVWAENRVFRHLTRFEGIGTAKAVRTVAIDAENRVWFSSDGFVGFYRENSVEQTPIQISLVTPTTKPLPVTPRETEIQKTPPVPVTRQQSSNVSGSSQQGLAPILDPILKAINSILAKIGLRPAS